jgi:hypothetical protein
MKTNIGIEALAKKYGLAFLKETPVDGRIYVSSTNPRLIAKEKSDFEIESPTDPSNAKTTFPKGKDSLLDLIGEMVENGDAIPDRSPDDFPDSLKELGIGENKSCKPRVIQLSVSEGRKYL